MDGYKKTVLIGILGFCANLILFILKITVGVMSNSYAMIADAMNSGSDILNSLMTLIGGKISQKKPCHKYPLGYGRAEYIFSVFMSVTMIIISAFIFKGSFLSLFDNEHIYFSCYIVFCCAVNIAIKFALYIYTRHIGRKYNNILIEVSGKDHRNDIFLAMSTLAGGLFGYMGVWFVDGIVGICIALWIFFTGVSLIRKSCAVLMDCDDCDDMRGDITEILDRINEIKLLESVVILHSEEQKEVRLSFCVDPYMTIDECARLKRNICDILLRNGRIGRILFQINPYTEPDK